MKLSSSNILQLDATILVGLLIFLTFQSFVSSTYDEQHNAMISENKQLSIERVMVEDYLKRICLLSDANIGSLYNTSNGDIDYSAGYLINDTYKHEYMQDMAYYSADKPSNCQEMKYKLYEIHFERDANEQWVEDLNVYFLNEKDSATFDEFFSTVVFFSTGAKMMSVLMTVIMIVPFSLSAIIIVFDSIYRTNKTETSDWAGKLVIIGFAAMIAGFSILMLFVTCATFPSLDCFNQSEFLKLPH